MNTKELGNQLFLIFFYHEGFSPKILLLNKKEGFRQDENLTERVCGRYLKCVKWICEEILKVDCRF